MVTGQEKVAGLGKEKVIGLGKEKVIGQEKEKVTKLVVRLSLEWHRMVTLERIEGWENVESQEQRESQEGDPLERTLQMVSQHSCSPVGHLSLPTSLQSVSCYCYCNY